jgi:hypothetical protein
MVSVSLSCAPKHVFCSWNLNSLFGCFCRGRLCAEKCAAVFSAREILLFLLASTAHARAGMLRLFRLRQSAPALAAGELKYFRHRIALGIIIIAFTAQIQQLNAAPAFVQASSGGQQGGSTTASTTATSTTVHNALVCFGRQQNNTTAVIADTAGNTFVLTMQRRETGSTIYTWIVPDLIANAANVVTITWGASVGFTYITCGEFSGTDNTAPRDVTTTNVNPGDTTSATFSTLRASEVIIDGMQADSVTGVWTAGAGYTIPAGATSPDTVMTFQYKIVATTQTAVTAAVSNTTPANLLMNIVSLTAPVGGGGGTQTSYAVTQ